MIRLVTGPLGTGKSLYMVKTGIEELEMGNLLVTNFDLVDDWAERVARRRRLRPNGPKARAYAEKLRDRHRRIESLPELMEVRVRKEPPYVKTDRRGEPVLGPDGEPILKEGVCTVLLDEAHRWMNARNWSKEGREEVLEFFALARKRGFKVYLGSQRKENLDVQVRELYEDHIQLENLKYSARFLGIRVIPFNFFLAAWSNHGWPNRYVKEQRYLLGWHRHLYDTMDVGSFSEVADSRGGSIWLPRGADSTTDDDAPVGARAARDDAAAPPAVASSPGSSTVPPPDPSL